MNPYLGLAPAKRLAEPGFAPMNEETFQEPNCGSLAPP